MNAFSAWVLGGRKNRDQRGRCNQLKDFFFAMQKHRPETFSRAILRFTSITKAGKMCGKDLLSSSSLERAIAILKREFYSLELLYHDCVVLIIFSFVR